MLNVEWTTMAERENPVLEKSYAFAIEIVRTVRRTQERQREYVLTKQLLRSGTSIGANVAEGNAAQTKKDFVAKMAVASKEARETHYWLRLLRDAQLLAEEEVDPLIARVEELIRLLTAIVKSAQTNG